MGLSWFGDPVLIDQTDVDAVLALKGGAGDGIQNPGRRPAGARVAICASTCVDAGAKRRIGGLDVPDSKGASELSGRHAHGAPVVAQIVRCSIGDRERDRYWLVPIFRMIGDDAHLVASVAGRRR